MATIMAEKGMIVYDQKTWNISGDWLDAKRMSELRDMLETKNPNSPYLEKNDDDFLDSLALTKEEDGRILPTTTGILFVGNAKALRELPYYEVKYIHYYSDGTYKPYEFKGNIISVAKECFAQLKSEIKQKEYIFGLFREFVEDYSEIVIRESCSMLLFVSICGPSVLELMNIQTCRHIIPINAVNPLYRHKTSQIPIKHIILSTNAKILMSRTTIINPNIPNILTQFE